jgi:FKBP-type peptidyl-prolyl cis-trans isomerase FkpA
MKLRHAAIAVSIVAVVALVAYARNQDPAAKPAASPSAAASPGAAGAAGASPAAAVTNDPQLFYALGVLLGQNVRILHLTPAELEQVKSGLGDSAQGKKTDIDLNSYGPKLQQFGAARIKEVTEAEKGRGTTFRDTAAKEAGAVQAPSGMVYKETTAGAGKSPAATDTVKVHYRGTLIDGTEFDSSIARGQPAEFPLNGVIPCWTEGVQRMKVGGKARLVCPSTIAYGDQGRPPTIPGGATLVFDVELLEIKAAASPAAAAPAAPAPPAGHPAAPNPSPTPTPTPTPKQ